MALTYTIHHAFAQGGQWYTRGNEDEVKALPREVRDRLIELGRITEHGTAPATTTTGTKKEG
jgi:hypothetical protein